MISNDDTLPSFDLSGGALGVDRKLKRTILLKPCGAPNGSYTGWCHIIICLHGGEETYSARTLEGVWEPEIGDWIRNKAGITTDGFEWIKLGDKPTFDTYLVDKLRREVEEKAARKAERKEKATKAAARKTERKAWFQAPKPAPDYIDI